ncbi:hypothetical protein C6T69_01135, partial [Burkholderia multivorans]
FIHADAIREYFRARPSANETGAEGAPIVQAGRDVLVTHVPSRIYLNLGDINELGEIPFQQLTGVTWCEDRVDDTDIEYVRAPAQAAEQVAQEVPLTMALNPNAPPLTMALGPAQAAEPVAQWQSRLKDRSSPVVDRWVNISPDGAKTLMEKYADVYEVRALYAAPQLPTQADAREGLTDEQREAIEYAITRMDLNVSNRDAYTAAKELRALLNGADHDQ